MALNPTGNNYVTSTISSIALLTAGGCGGCRSITSTNLRYAAATYQ